MGVVPFYAFGSPESSQWFRVSVGTIKRDEIDECVTNLENALKKLS